MNSGKLLYLEQAFIKVPTSLNLTVYEFNLGKNYH